MSGVGNTPKTPPSLDDDELVEVVLDGIAGNRRSFARWALFELHNRLAAARDPKRWDEFLKTETLSGT